jgi:4'-phosphopantetheinyl transferase
VPAEYEVFTRPLDWSGDFHLPKILSAEERERSARFVRPADCARYGQSHVFLRETLSRFADVAPGEWQFTRGEFGRPTIAAPIAGLGLQFNLSHTWDWAAVVVTRGVPCGIDVERIRPIQHMLDIARRLFAPEEFRKLDELPEEALQRRFFELWTEKEAWVKAHGRGLSLPVNRKIAEIPGVKLARCRSIPDHAMAVVLLPTGPAPR